jgi:hypothetical protein
VKEIEQEAYGEHGMATQDPKQTAAVDLSNRLKDLRAGNDGSRRTHRLVQQPLNPSRNSLKQFS